MNWFYLVLAGMFEIGFTTCMKMSEGFTKLYPSIGFLICAVFSFWLLTKALSSIPLGTAYAIWTGIGAFGTAVIGMYYFNDPVNAARVTLLLLLIGSVIGLKVCAN